MRGCAAPIRARPISNVLVYQRILLHPLRAGERWPLDDLTHISGQITSHKETMSHE